MDKVRVTTVTPVYRGERYLEDLVAELERVRSGWKSSGSPIELVEAIFVDDASPDGSAAALERLAGQHPWVRVVTLSRNFGQHPATIAGILYSSGDWVVTLDEDLQHEPRHVTALLRAAVQNGLDVVYARPEHAVHRQVWRNLSSRIHKTMLAWIARNPAIRHFNSFRLLRGSVARAAASVCGHETYFDIALGWFTGRTGTLALPLADPRGSGGGYGLRRLLSHARRAIVSSQTRVLRVGALVGGLAVAVSLVLGIRIVVLKTLDPSSVQVPGWPSLFVSVLFFGGVLCLMLAVALEYLSNVVLHTQGKPSFFVVDRSLDRVLVEHFEREQDADTDSAAKRA